MGTRRRRQHKKRYRGGDEFVEQKFAAPAGNVPPRTLALLKRTHDVKERARYEAWKAKREVEAREDAKGREEDAKMADFYAKQKREREHELINTAQQRAEASIESTREADDKRQRNECRDYLRSHTPPLKNPEEVKNWLADKSNMRENPADYKEVRDCLRFLTAKKEGAGRRKTRRLKSHRRR